MPSAAFAAEGGYQDFVLHGGEWLVLVGSVLTALLAIAVGFVLMQGVLREDEGTPTMVEIAKAIQEGALAYLKRQFRTIGYILVPLAIIVFVTSVAVEKENGTEALSFILNSISMAEFEDAPTESDCTISEATAKALGLLSN